MITNSRTAKFVAGFVGLAMALSFVAPSVAGASTISDLQAQIAALSAQLAALSGGTTSSTGYTFNVNLTMGSKGTDVMNLQKVLNMSSDTMVSSTGAGSPGNETSTFGGLTRAAVIKFQIKNGITPAAGYVGPVTRAKLNGMAGTTVTGTTTGTTGTTLPTGGALTVSAGTQPTNSLAPKGASRVPFTNFTLTAGANDVTVNSVTVQRSGLAQDAAVAGVVLLDASTGIQVGIAKTLNSNHQATIGEATVIKAGTSRTFTIAANMASSLTSYTGQVLSLDLIGINTSASVSGSLPITGAQQTLNDSLTIGTASINTSSFDPNTAGSQPIGTTGYRFTGLKLTAGSAEDLTFKSIRWNQSGSVGSTDLANVVTIVNGTSYPTVVSVDGKYYTTVFPSGIVIGKGNSIDVYVQGDIIGSGAAGRTAEFDIYKNTDIYLTGNTYGYGVVAPTGSNSLSGTATHATTINTSTNPFIEASTLSITAGSVTLLGKAPEVPSQNIAVNVPNQILGGFATNFSGEPVSVQSMYFSISTTSGSLPTTANSPYSAITSISIVDQNGTVVAGPVDAALADGSTAHGNVISAATSYAWVHFTDTVTFPVGRRVYTIKGKIPSTWSNGTIVTLYTKPSTDWTSVTGQTTGNSISLSAQSTAFSLNTMTVKGPALAVNIAAQPASQNVVAGVQNFVLANYQLDATQSGEDIRLSSFPIVVASSAVGDLSGCALWQGSTQLNTGSRVINTLSATTVKTNISFDNSLVIPKGTAVTLAFSCNIASGATATNYQVTADSTATDFSITGVTSGNSVTPTFGSGNGGTMTRTSGSFTAAIDSSTMNYTVVAGGATGVNIGTYKFRATNENVNLNKIGLTLSTSTASDIGTVYLYANGAQIGQAVFPQGAGATATSTLTTPLMLPRDTDVLVTIKSDLGSIGTGQSGTEGRLIKIDVTNAEGSGLSSGLTLTTSGVTAGSNGVRMFKSFPTIAIDSSLPTTGVSDGNLMRFKITADSHGPVGIYDMSFTIATSSFVSGGGVSAIKLFVYSDAQYSQAVSGTYGSSTGQFGGTNGTSTLKTAPYANTPLINFVADTNPLEIPAGQTYYFQLKATVASTQAGTSVTATMLGDAAYIAASNFKQGTDFVGTAVSAVADTNNSFIWSGNATTTAVFGSNDWANGYGLLGLPAGGLTNTRQN